MATKNISLTGSTVPTQETLSVNVGTVPVNTTVWLDMVVIGKSSNGAVVVASTMAIFHLGTQVSSQTDESKRLDKGSANSWSVHPSVGNDGSVVVTVHSHAASVDWSVFAQWYES